MVRLSKTSADILKPGTAHDVMAAIQSQLAATIVFDADAWRSTKSRTRQAKRPDPGTVRSARSYTIPEAAGVLGVSAGSITEQDAPHAFSMARNGCGTLTTEAMKAIEVRAKRMGWAG